MRRLFLVLVVFLVAATFVAAGELELGLGFSPPMTEEDSESIYSFHAGYSFWWLFYGAVDSYVMPPWAMENLTGKFDPGFVHMYNLGFRPRIGPLMALATVGTNNLYLYKQAEQYPDMDPEFGVNMRLGVGWRGKAHWSVMFSGVWLFENPEQLENYLNELATATSEEVMSSLYPTITLNLWF